MEAKALKGVFAAAALLLASGCATHEAAQQGNSNAAVVLASAGSSCNAAAPLGVQSAEKPILVGSITPRQRRKAHGLSTQTAQAGL